jgi:hypothetical protein
MSSQMSFAAILGRFLGGIVVLKNVLAYNPAKLCLVLTNLESVAADAEAKNSAAIITGTKLKELRNERRSISFRSKESDVNCIENLIRNIASYLKAELGAKNPSYSAVDSIVKKIAPPNDPREEVKEGEEPKKSNSASEKSYTALGGFCTNVLALITEMGEAYKPSNTNISAAAFKAKADRLVQLNGLITTAGTNYKNAVNERDEVYNGADGINSLFSQIKDYLASFEGGKKNPDYIAFVNAVK